MVGNIIKNMRTNVGISQKELGAKLNMADTTISSYERGNSQPDFETILKIAEICCYEFQIVDKKDGRIISIEKMSR